MVLFNTHGRKFSSFPSSWQALTRSARPFADLASPAVSKCQSRKPEVLDRAAAPLGAGFLHATVLRPHAIAAEGHRLRHNWHQGLRIG